MPRGTSPLDEARLQGRLWTPALAGPAMWLDAADLSTLQVSSGAVTQWSDKSGNGRHATQTTSGNRPTYVERGVNGLPSISFNGSSNFFSLPDGTIPSGSTAYHFCVAFQITGAHRGGLIGTFVSSFTQPGNNVNSFRVEDSGEGGGLVNYWWSNDIAMSGAVQTAAPVFAATEWASGIVDAIYVNSAVAVAAARTGKNTTSTNCRIGITADFGAGYSNLTDWFNGFIGEELVFHRSLSTPERRALEGYMAWKWQAPGNLPADHPFRNRPPLIGD